MGRTNYISTKMVGEILGCTRQRVSQLVKSGQISVAKNNGPGRSRYFDRDEIEAYAAVRAARLEEYPKGGRPKGS